MSQYKNERLGKVIYKGSNMTKKFTEYIQVVHCQPHDRMKNT